MSRKRTKRTRQANETPLEAFASVCSVLAIGLFTLTFVCQNFVIPSSSMASTLLVGDHVVVDRVSLSPSTPWAPLVHYGEVHRYDVIVFYKPQPQPDGSHSFFVKRVVGIPGDRIHLRNGIVYLNGAAQDEPQVAKPDPANYDSYRDDFPSIAPSNISGVTAGWSATLPSHVQGEDLVVPPGNYFAMGDNRTNSLDSRYWGFVPRSNIVGRPLFVYWSFAMPENEMDRTAVSDKLSFVMNEVVHFVDQTRWRRTFHSVN